jgi:hypothetical protein
MIAKHWTVNYSRKDGSVGSIVIEWPSEPSKETAAIRIREHLLGKSYLLVDTPRGHNEPTLFLLRSYGFEINKIDELNV